MKNLHFGLTLSMTVALAVAVDSESLAGAPPATAAMADVRSFGAAGDGKTLDTEAIQRAIDTCSREGGGTIRFPAGRYVSGTILLKDNVTLRLDQQAVLLGSTNIADYQLIDPFRSGNGAPMGYCFVGAVDAKHVAIEGTGLIDGRGKELLAARSKGNSARPFLVRFVRCTGVSVKQVRLESPAAWTMHFSQCRDVTAEQVKITSRGLGNNDGIDIDSSQGVRIKGCDIDSGDDAICLKTTSTTPCRDVEVTGCNLTSNCAGIKFGTESVADFDDIRISGCRIHDTRLGGIKLLSVDGARLQNVSISDITMDNVNMPIFVRLGARLKTFRTGDEKQAVGAIRNLRIKNVRAQTASPLGIFISGIPEHAVETLALEDIVIRLPGGGTDDEARVVLSEEVAAYPEISMFGKRMPAYGLFARHVRGLKLRGVKFEPTSPDLRPAVICQDGQDLELTDWTLPADADAECLVRFESVRNAVLSDLKTSGTMKTFLQVDGPDSENIQLTNCSLGRPTNTFQLGAGVKTGTISRN